MFLKYDNVCVWECNWPKSLSFQCNLFVSSIYLHNMALQSLQLLRTDEKRINTIHTLLLRRLPYDATYTMQMWCERARTTTHDWALINLCAHMIKAQPHIQNEICLRLDKVAWCTRARVFGYCVFVMIKLLRRVLWIESWRIWLK